MQGEKRALLFDLGDISRLSNGKILKISDVFISHTHIDHFIGFDKLLRVSLGREKRIRIYGPPGIINNIEGKLKGYTWNLIEDYTLELEVHEVYPDRVESALFQCKHRFQKELVNSPSTFQGVLLDDPLFTIEAVHVDHGTPVLAFLLTEKFRININKDMLMREGLPTGSWLRKLKKSIRNGDSDEHIVDVEWEEGGVLIKKQFELGYLRDNFTIITQGQKISYVVDMSFSDENVSSVANLIHGSNILFCEAVFLDKDSDKAEGRFHLTAKQAGYLARETGVKRLVVFHFSPRYEHCPEALIKEANEAFQQ